METAQGIRKSEPVGYAPLYAIVLAAGAGTRFGGAKLLSLFDGRVLVEAAIRAACAAPVEGVIVVTQPGMEHMPWVRGPKLAAIACADWTEGMAASLRTGIGALSDDVAGAFIFLGDMPRIPVEVLGPLAEAVRAGAPAALPTFEVQDGHPVLFARALFPDLLKLTGDRGGRSVIAALGERAVRIEAPSNGVLLDVDSPDDLERLRQGGLPPIAN